MPTVCQAAWWELFISGCNLPLGLVAGVLGSLLGWSQSSSCYRSPIKNQALVIHIHCFNSCEYLLSACCMQGTIPGSGTSEAYFHLFEHILNTNSVPGTCDTKVLTDSVHLWSACCVPGGAWC